MSIDRPMRHLRSSFGRGLLLRRLSSSPAFRCRRWRRRRQRRLGLSPAATTALVAFAGRSARHAVPGRRERRGIGCRCVRRHRARHRRPGRHHRHDHRRPTTPAFGARRKWGPRTSVRIDGSAHQLNRADAGGDDVLQRRFGALIGHAAIAVGNRADLHAVDARVGSGGLRHRGQQRFRPAKQRHSRQRQRQPSEVTSRVVHRSAPSASIRRFRTITKKSRELDGILQCETRGSRQIEVDRAGDAVAFGDRRRDRGVDA